MYQQKVANYPVEFEAAVNLLTNAIEAGLEYYRQTGSFAYVAEYEDGEMRIVYNAASAKEARPGVDFKIRAYAKWVENLGNPLWVIGAIDEYGNYKVVEEVFEEDDEDEEE